jgi:phage terminase large subunit
MTSTDGKKHISIREIIGGGYDEFWKSKKRYLPVKGSRASKKSSTASLKIITRTMQYPLANTLVVRQTGASLKDSC